MAAPRQVRCCAFRSQQSSTSLLHQQQLAKIVVGARSEISQASCERCDQRNEGAWLAQK